MAFGTVEYVYPAQDRMSARLRTEALSQSDQATATTQTASNEGFFGADGFTFGDILDMVNPLQHIPIVSNIYRAITGDTASAASRIAGGGIFGGPIGLLMSAINVGIETGGGDIGSKAIAALTQDGNTQLASRVATAYGNASRLS